MLGFERDLFEVGFGDIVTAILEIVGVGCVAGSDFDLRCRQSVVNMNAAGAASESVLPCNFYKTCYHGIEPANWLFASSVTLSSHQICFPAGMSRVLPGRIVF